MPQRRPPRNQAGQPDTQIAREFREAVSKLAPIVSGEFVPAINEFGENIKKTAEAIKRFNRLEVYGTFAALAYQIKAFTSIQKSLSQGFLNQILSNITEFYKTILNPLLTVSTKYPLESITTNLLALLLHKFYDFFITNRNFYEATFSSLFKEEEHFKKIVPTFFAALRIPTFYLELFQATFKKVESEFKNIAVSELNLGELFDSNKESFTKAFLILATKIFRYVSEHIDHLLMISGAPSFISPEGYQVFFGTFEECIRSLDSFPEYKKITQSAIKNLARLLSKSTDFGDFIDHFFRIIVNTLRQITDFVEKETSVKFVSPVIQALTGLSDKFFETFSTQFRNLIKLKIPKHLLLSIATLLHAISPLFYKTLRDILEIQKSLQPTEIKKSFFDPILNFFKSIGDSFSRIIPGPVAKAIGKIKTSFTALVAFAEKILPAKLSKLAVIAAPFLLQYYRSYRQLFTPIETRAQYSAIVAGTLAGFNRAVRLLQIEVAQRTALASMLATATARQLLENTKETVILLAKLVLYMSVLIGQILRPIVWLIDQIARVVNWLEELLSYIATYFGYQRQENRPASDLFFEFMNNLPKNKGIVPLPPDWNKAPGDF